MSWNWKSGAFSIRSLLLVLLGLLDFCPTFQCCYAATSGPNRQLRSQERLKCQTKSWKSHKIYLHIVEVFIINFSSCASREQKEKSEKTRSERSNISQRLCEWFLGTTQTKTEILVSTSERFAHHNKRESLFWLFIASRISKKSETAGNFVTHNRARWIKSRRRAQLVSCCAIVLTWTMWNSVRSITSRSIMGDKLI